MSKFPLRLMPSVRRVAEEFSQREGVSLNQFINVAVAEKLAHLQHHEWVASKPGTTAASIARGLAILDRPTGNVPDPDDELPEGYMPVRNSSEYKKILATDPSRTRAVSARSAATTVKRKNR